MIIRPNLKVNSPLDVEIVEIKTIVERLFLQITEQSVDSAERFILFRLPQGSYRCALTLLEV